MPSVLSLRRSRGGVTRGLFAIEVDDLEVRELLEATTIATAPYSLMDWMRVQASPLMAHTIAERFGDRGGGGAYEWAPLAESTIRIKEALGITDPEEPNTRSEQMLRTYLYDHGYELDPLGATLLIPDMSGISDLMWKKMYTAEHGWTQGPGEMFPGAYTPPRPIAWLDATDVTMLMTSLQFHIMETIEMLVGGSPIGMRP